MRVSVENYKSIYKKMSISINGMTIIAGSNSSGKSSFMQPFMILKQTVENNSDGESLIINGENA
ncbi:AAA family ATPase, partial [Acinetobacter baumannii]|nr:AAA family ATPase [Acinetobacter baumannii]